MIIVTKTTFGALEPKTRYYLTQVHAFRQERPWVKMYADIGMQELRNSLVRGNEYNVAADRDVYVRTEDAQPEPVLTVRVAPGLLQVLELDDTGLCREMHITVAKAGKGLAISGTREALYSLADTCFYRMDMSAWDQPLWYASSAAAARRKIYGVLGERIV